MTEQRSLWDHVEAGHSKGDALRQVAEDKTRRETIKKLRSSGHWLTLLRVARTIPQPFTLNDISVAVWKACPEFFGMKGYPYPDNHKVHYNPLRRPRAHRQGDGAASQPGTFPPTRKPRLGRAAEVEPARRGARGVSASGGRWRWPKCVFVALRCYPPSPLASAMKETKETKQRKC